MDPNILYVTSKVPAYYQIDKLKEILSNYPKTEVHGAGNAISTAVELVQRFSRDHLARIIKINTSSEDIKDGTRKSGKMVKIIIILEREKDFEEKIKKSDQRY